jgi:hypothetical protein
MDDDRAVGITFSLKLSEIDKLEVLIRRSGKNRSELLSLWLNKEFETLVLTPVELTKQAEG